MSAPRIHHLNCGTLCPWGAKLLNRTGGALASARLVCHVLLLELDGGLLLVDTGFGAQDTRNPSQINPGFRVGVRPRLDPAETAVAQIESLGFQPGDVRHIVLTHADIDHGGGVPDFPGAEVHIFGDERRAMLSPPLRERVRYAIAAPHWRHGPTWVVHELGGDRWLGFESVRVLAAGDADVLMIPLPGHTLGHTGVAVQREDGWLLHCGDAFFHRGELERPPTCPVGLRAFQAAVDANGRLRRENQERLRELAGSRGDEVTLFCSHDPVQLERAQAGSSS
jgi:glyoxylase-like metal-dependent hydrolase (beta-lactamase superfamily II)